MPADHHPVEPSEFRRRIDAVRDRADIAAIVGRVVKLGRGSNPRGKCPFHGSKSDSFSVEADKGRARCWGCGWAGDAIKFVQDYHGLSFTEALARLEEENGLDGLTPTPIRRIKRAAPRRERPTVDSTTMGRAIWRMARPDPAAIRTYFRSRGVPEAMLADDRFADIRFTTVAPIVAWREDAGASSVPQAPAIAALVRRAGDWTPIGLHVTYLAPDLAAKMKRQRQDGSAYPARKMLGESSGGCVLLGAYADDVPLFVGEGLETVLSGMALADAKPGACGLAVLSLDNLQGRPRLIKGALPIYDPAPDREVSAAVAFARQGPVTGLIDADMKPLRGQRLPQSGAWRGVPVIERQRGPVVHRTVTTAERATICALLFTAAWRAKGCRVTAMRPRMGLDFNDAVREVRA